MAETTCPQCGKKADGSFCSWCGAALGALHCRECGAGLEPGARFCNACGAPIARGSGGEAPGERAAAGAGSARGGGASSGGSDGAGTSQLGWWVAGGAMVALILIIAYPVLRQAEVAPTGTMAPAAGGSPADVASGPSSVDLSSMTPREAADRLYERVMTAASAGDSAQVASFLPMSVQAYERARPLDADGLFHLSLLRQTGGDFAGALAAAREALEDDPNHLLNLGAAAQAAHVMGDDESAREYYERLLEVWDAEQARGLEEYELHSRTLPGLRQEAQDFLAR